MVSVVSLVAGYLGVDFKLGKFDSQTKRCPYFLGCTTWCSLHCKPIPVMKTGRVCSVYIQYVFICCLVKGQ